MSTQYVEAPDNANGDTHGATAPGSGITPAKGVLVIILTSAAGLVALRILFRSPAKASVSASASL